MPSLFKKKLKLNQAGFGIVESMASIGILVTATFGFMACYRFSIDSFTEVKKRAAAVERLNNVIETFRFRGQADLVVYDIAGNIVVNLKSAYDQNGNLLPGYFQVGPDADADTLAYNLNPDNKQFGTKYKYAVTWVGVSGQLKTISYEVFK